MRFGSVCSGIEAAGQAWKTLGWEPYFLSEIEKFPSAVLAKHYGSNMPDEELTKNGVPNYGDMTRFKEWPDHGNKSDRPIDVLVGGTPCQSFSVAGLREGLADPRGNLMLTFGAIAERYQPRWFVWENVPGVLSSNSGRDFGAFLRLMGECGYGFSYRVLDAQYVRVDGFERAIPQRRRRVFVVGYLGDWRPAAAVLSEPEGLLRHSAPSREPRQKAASSSGGGTTPSGSSEILTPADMLAFGVYGKGETASTMKARDYKDATDLVASSGAMGIPGNWIGRKPENGGNSNKPTIEVSPCITSSDRHGVACEVASTLTVGDDQTWGRPAGDPIAQKINKHNIGWQVRRLTPVECERLQGFPDNYTRIPWRGKPEEKCPDSVRYKALGNSMAINCMRWIGTRIEMVESLMEEINGC